MRSIPPCEDRYFPREGGSVQTQSSPSGMTILDLNAQRLIKTYRSVTLHRFVGRARRGRHPATERRHVNFRYNLLRNPRRCWANWVELKTSGEGTSSRSVFNSLSILSGAEAFALIPALRRSSARTSRRAR